MSEREPGTLLTLEIQRARITAGEEVEVIERKGFGHPDSIADAISAQVQMWIAAESRSSDGIPYAYVDKTLVICGVAEPHWGGGSILIPCRAIVPIVVSEKTDLSGCDAVVRGVIQERVPLYPVSDIPVDIVRRPPSAHSLRTFSSEPCGSEDSCVSVAYAPQSPLESAVRELEGDLTSLRQSHPAIGTDAKWLVFGTKRSVRIVAAVALIGQRLSSVRQYRHLKDCIRQRIAEAIQPLAENVEVAVNPDDRYRISSVYLTVTGSSVEGGDCGVTGRGNRWNGLICAMRPISIEAACGKPSVNHPSVFGSRAAEIIAEALARQSGIRRAEVAVISRVGDDVRQPTGVMARLVADRAVSGSKLKGVVGRTLRELADGYPDVTSVNCHRQANRWS